MKMRTGTNGLMNGDGGGPPADARQRVGHEWEVRPGGMVVQRRTDQSSGEPPLIRVRVKYGSLYHEISINSQATFGELKKMLSGPTGLNHRDMKLMYKDKERDAKAFLDLSGVKHRSKLILLEDPIAQEKRLLEMRKNANLDKASKAISEISLGLDRLGGQVSAFETVINKGGRIEETSLGNLIEMLMNQLLKLDAVTADGDVKLQRKMQVRRVQKYVETLDALKIKNNATSIGSDGTECVTKFDEQRKSNGCRQEQIQGKQSQNLLQHPYHYNNQQQLDLLSYDHPRNSSSSSSEQVFVTTKWETFDPAMAPSTSASNLPENNNPIPPRFKWELFE